MGTTTFTGPIKAGNIPNTSGNTLGTNVKNVGDVVLSQTNSITQAGSATAYATNIVIPANSCILSIQSINVTAWDTTNTIIVGVSSDANELVPTGVAMTVGVVNLSPGTNPFATSIWQNTGSNDLRIWVKSANTGVGVGTLIVRYLQNHSA